MKPFSIILFYSILVSAQITWQPTTNFTNTNNASSTYPALCSESVNYYLAWVENDKINFSRSPDLGNNWSQPLTTANTSNPCSMPALASNYNYVYLTYQQRVGEYEIIFQYSSDFGQTWSQMIGVSGMSSKSKNPKLAAFLTNVFLVYEQDVNGNSEIYFTRSTNYGADWSQPVNLSNTPAIKSNSARIEYAGAHLYCSWIESTPQTYGDIFFCRSSDNGLTWSTPVNVSNNGRYKGRIDMKLAGNSIIYVSSDEQVTPSAFDIFLTSSTDNGNTWNTPMNVTNNETHSKNSSLAVYGDFVYLVWNDTDSLQSSNPEVFFNWSANKGLTWNTPVNLSENAGQSFVPLICAAINGPLPAPWIELFTVWFDNTTDVNEIYTKRGIHTAFPQGVNAAMEGSAKLNLKHFPNPCRNFVTITFTPSSYISGQGIQAGFALFDLMGSKIMATTYQNLPQGENTIRIDLSHLSPGVYCFRIVTDAESYSGKLLIIR